MKLRTQIVSFFPSYTAYLLLFFVALALASCNPAKKLSDGEYLLNKNIIIDKTSGLEKNDMEAYIKQKPNRKMLVWKFYLNVYNSINQDKLEKKKMRKNAKIEAINAKRIEKNKRENKKRIAKGKPIQKVILNKKNTLTYREWLLSIGEPPVIIDSVLTKKSSKQIKLFLNNKGFFNSTVKDSTVIKRKKAKVYYTINAGLPYKVRNVSYEMKDEQLHYYVLSDATHSFLKRGINYDLDIMQEERTQITNLLRNDGYYNFSKEFIYYEVDSTLKTREVDITLGIKNPQVKQMDTLVKSRHSRYYIRNIYIYTDYDPQLKLPPKDTIIENDYFIMSTGRFRYKPGLISNAIFISKGELFQQSHADQTYSRLSQLKIFRSVQLQFVDVGQLQLDCHIYLSNVPKQSFSAETEGTNTSGTLGIAGNLVYQNKNSFRGGEIFEIKIKGALEVQKTKTQKKSEIFTGSGVDNPFNTKEIGGELNLLVPRFLTPFKIRGTKSNHAKTNFTNTYNYQKRPDFGRSIANISYGYSWNETATKKHIINPVEFNLVNIFDLTPGLQNSIESSPDLFLRNSYSDHFTLGTRYAFIFNNQKIHKQRSFSFLRIGAEGAGNTMRGIFDLIDSSALIKYRELDFDIDSTQNKNGDYAHETGYTIENIRFSQFVRFDLDYRYYKLLNEKDKLVFRFAVGVGKPFSNLRVLPLEKSFFGGGPNSVRAWEARTLGPGSFNDSASVFADKIGDAKVEANFEYRFNVIKLLNVALFVDAGNIWLRKKYESYPGGEFFNDTVSTLNFARQFAIGAGIGFRLDFNFFIIRLDWAFKVRDPARVSNKPDSKENDPWVYTHYFQKNWKDDYIDRYKHKYPFMVVNFGIGYPF